MRVENNPYYVTSIDLIDSLNRKKCSWCWADQALHHTAILLHLDNLLLVFSDINAFMLVLLNSDLLWFDIIKADFTCLVFNTYFSRILGPMSDDIVSRAHWLLLFLLIGHIISENHPLLWSIHLDQLSLQQMFLVVLVASHYFALDADAARIPINFTDGANFSRWFGRRWSESQVGCTWNEAKNGKTTEVMYFFFLHFYKLITAV